MVVHGMDGIDEISTIGKTRISWLKKDKITTFETYPKDFGVKLAKPMDVKGMGPKENAEILFKILTGYLGKNSPKTDIVLVNSVAGIIVSGKAENFDQGMELALESIQSGAAYDKLKALVKASSGDMSKLERLEQKYG
jgi:anthranilate phosphoribosyltransferase